MEMAEELSRCKVVCLGTGVESPPRIKVIQMNARESESCGGGAVGACCCYGGLHLQVAHIHTPLAPLERLLRHNIPESSETRIVVHLLQLSRSAHVLAQSRAPCAGCYDRLIRISLQAIS